MAAPAALFGGGQREEINEKPIEKQVRPENYQTKLKKKQIKPIKPKEKLRKHTI